MNVINKTTAPNVIIPRLEEVLGQFTCLQSNEPLYVTDFYASTGNDRTYTILLQGDHLYVLIAADHPDPTFEAAELMKLSKKYSFKHVVTPIGDTLDIITTENDDLPDTFFIKKGMTYYYCAEAIVTS